MLNELALIAYGGIGYNSYDLIKAELERKIENYDRNMLNHIQEIIRTKGLYEGLKYLTELPL